MRYKNKETDEVHEFIISRFSHSVVCGLEVGNADYYMNWKLDPSAELTCEKCKEARK